MNTSLALHIALMQAGNNVGFQARQPDDATISVLDGGALKRILGLLDVIAISSASQVSF